MLGAQARSQLAAIDATTAAVSPWAPPVGEDVTSIEAARDGVIVGRYRQIIDPAVSVTPSLEIFPEPLPAIPGPPADVASFSAGSSVSIQWSEPAIGGRPTTYILEAGSSPGGTEPRQLLDRFDLHLVLNGRHPTGTLRRALTRRATHSARVEPRMKSRSMSAHRRAAR